MTTEQQRKMLECAAKACRIEISTWSNCQAGGFVKGGSGVFWNPLTNPADTAEMSAKLGIDTCFYLQLSRVTCDFYSGTDHIRVRVEFKDHDNSRLKAWMYAATIVAAKIGGYEE